MVGVHSHIAHFELGPTSPHATPHAQRATEFHQRDPRHPQCSSDHSTQGPGLRERTRSNAARQHPDHRTPAIDGTLPAGYGKRVHARTDESRRYPVGYAAGVAHPLRTILARFMRRSRRTFSVSLCVSPVGWACEDANTVNHDIVWLRFQGTKSTGNSGKHG